MNRADRLLLAYLAALLVLSVPLHLWLVDALVLALIAGILATVWLARRSRAGRVLHAFHPVVTIIGCYDLSGPILARINPARWDETLAALDLRWFGLQAASWRAALGRPDWLTDLASFAYVSFYVVPFVIALELLRHDEKQLDEFVSTVVTAFVLTWIGYALFPATGPRIATADADAIVGGGAISRATRTFLAVAERNRLDAFPSGHAALALVYLVEGGRRLPRWRVPLAITTTAMVFATVYLSVHYAVDVLAGLAVGALGLALPALARRVPALEPEGAA
jgi:membrane-associated phospholipid phosphatase